MTQNQNFDQILDLLTATGLNWEVSKEALISSVDNSKTGSFGLFKKTSRQHLGTVGNQYTLFQNWQLAESLLIATQELGLSVTNGGSLNNGGKVYLQAALEDVHIGKSDMKRNLTALNSHDGSTSINFGSSNTVVVCQNTFYRASQDLTKFRHTASAAERIKAMALGMNQALKAEANLITTFKVMADTKLEDRLIERVVANIFALKPGMSNADLSGRKKNQLVAFGDALQTEIGLEGNTVWGLFNAVTRYTNHVVRANDTQEEKLSYLMTGGGYQISNKTFDMLAQELGIKFVDSELQLA